MKAGERTTCTPAFFREMEKGNKVQLYTPKVQFPHLRFVSSNGFSYLCNRKEGELCSRGYGALLQT